MHRVWAGWSERRERAWVNGFAFDEPPPSPNSVSRYQDGVVDGGNKMFRMWQEWNERRMAAERADQPFTEPPPSLNGNSNRNGS